MSKTTRKQRRLRLLDLADLIEDADRRFDYDHWCAIRASANSKKFVYIGMTVDDLIQHVKLGTYDCTTVGCVAGWGAQLALDSGFEPKHYREMTVSQYAAEFLGLKPHERDAIFLGSAMIDAGFADPDDDTDDIRTKVTPVEVAKMLRMVAEDEVLLSS